MTYWEHQTIWTSICHLPTSTQMSHIFQLLFRAKCLKKLISPKSLVVCSGTECKVAVPPTQYAFHLDVQVLFILKLFLSLSLLNYYPFTLRGTVHMAMPGWIFEISLACLPIVCAVCSNTQSVCRLILQTPLMLPTTAKVKGSCNIHFTMAAQLCERSITKGHTHNSHLFI